MNSLARIGLAAALLASSTCVARSEEVVLKLYSSLPESLLFTKLFFEEFVVPLNAANKGVLKLEFVGGPEVMAPDKGADALERGIFDISWGPSGYYVGKVPEGLALHASAIDAVEARKTGAIEVIEKVWAKKLNAKVIAWGASGSGYNIYLTKPPTTNTPERLGLEGLKIRGSATYKPVIDTFGATMVSIPASELFTSLQSGLVDGTGWSQVGMLGSGADKVVKYRIDPAFFRNSELILVNMDRWNGLPEPVKMILADAGARYEAASTEKMNSLWKAETAELKKLGIEVIELSGAARDHYLENSRKLLWETVEQKVENSADLAKALGIKTTN